MKKIEIKSKISGKVVFSVEAISFKIAVELAVNAGADLSGADLYGAYLCRADMSGADLSRADMSGAYLAGAYLAGINLAGADLSGVDLSRADLAGADLSGANLAGACLSGADLSGANLAGIKTPPVNDCYFISEILFRAAKTENQKNFAGRIRIDTSLCWNICIVELAKKMKVLTWAKKTLRWKEYREKINDLLVGVEHEKSTPNDAQAPASAIVG
jgi:hypothetical protein